MEKYIQVGYYLPATNNSIFSIETQDTPFEGINVHTSTSADMSETDNFHSWIITSDESITDVRQTGDYVEARKRAELSANAEFVALFETAVDSCSLIYSNAERTSHKWWQAKITVDDSYDMGNIHNDILSSSTYDADGNLQENISEVEVVESQVTGYSNWSQIS